MTDLLDRYLSCPLPVAELAAQAGVTLADLAPLDAALPGEDVELPPHVDRALRLVLTPVKPKPDGKRTIPLIGRRGSGSPIQYGSMSERLVLAMQGGCMRTVPDLAESLTGVNKARTREMICKALVRLRESDVTTEIGGDPPRQWCLTPLGEQAARKLREERR